MQMWNVEDKKKMNGCVKKFCLLRFKSNRSVTNYWSTPVLGEYYIKSGEYVWELLKI